MKTIIIIITMIICSIIVSAVSTDVIPQKSMNFKDIYNITNVNKMDANTICFNADCRTNWSIATTFNQELNTTSNVVFIMVNSSNFYGNLSGFVNASYILNAPWITTDTNDTTAVNALLTSNLSMYASNASQSTELAALRASNTSIWTTLGTINATAILANTTANAALPKTGGIITTNNITMSDNIKIYFGTDYDTYIFFNSTGGYGEIG